MYDFVAIAITSKKRTLQYGFHEKCETGDITTTTSANSIFHQLREEEEEEDEDEGAALGYRASGTNDLLLSVCWNDVDALNMYT